VTPIREALDIIDSFNGADPRYAAVVRVLRGFVEKQTIDGQTGEHDGPRISVISVARAAGLSRHLLSHSVAPMGEGWSLIQAVLKVLASASLQAKCDYLEMENKELHRKLDFHVSQTAELMVQVRHLEKSNATGRLPPKRKGSRATPQDAREASNILPMSSIGVRKPPT